jgi:uridine kinase
LVRVAIDGVDTAGKTTLADELAQAASAAGRPALRATIDGFHHPRETRYRRGPDSPEGYFADSFDLEALRRVLLDPLSPGGDGRVQTRLFDHRADKQTISPVIVAPPDCILLFDGVFLQQPALKGCFDVIIFVQVSFETMLARAVQRDSAALGGEEAARARYRTRYIPAQQRYLADFQPQRHADIIVKNDDPDRPGIVFNRS